MNRHINYAMHATRLLLLYSMLLIVISFSAAMNPLYAQQQTGHVTGHVTDAEGKAQANATVRVTQIGLTTHTEDNGDFNLSLPEGNYTIVVSHMSFGTASQQISLKSSENFWLNIQLTGKSSELEEGVVTGLGITRATKSVGYSVQQVDGSLIQEAHETNGSSR